MSPSLAGQSAKSFLKSGFSKAEVRLITGRQYGFANWRQLKIFLLTCIGNGQTPTLDFTRSPCLTYRGNADCDQTLEMHEQNPAMAKQDIYHPCCVGDIQAVSQFLVDNEPNKTGAFFGWEPLVYACYSRLNLPAKSTLEVAQVLLEHGSMLNAAFTATG